MSIRRNVEAECGESSSVLTNRPSVDEDLAHETSGAESDEEPSPFQICADHEVEAVPCRAPIVRPSIRAILDIVCVRNRYSLPRPIIEVGPLS